MSTAKLETYRNLTDEEVLADIREIYALSAKIGEFVQGITLKPADAHIALLITLGRLLAREGKVKTVKEAWGLMTDPGSMSLFLMGFEEEQMLKYVSDYYHAPESNEEH